MVALVVLAIGFGVIERLWPARRQRRWREGMWTDLAYWFATPLLSRIATFAAFVGVAVTFALLAREPLDRAHLDALLHRETWFTAQPHWLQAVMALAIGDLVGYWMHRAFHARRLWPFHAVHHSSVDLIFGTFYMPADRVPSELGASPPVPTGILRQLKYPFGVR